jgi:hypothetical protein
MRAINGQFPGTQIRLGAIQIYPTDFVHRQSASHSLHPQHQLAKPNENHPTLSILQSHQRPHTLQVEKQKL